MSVASGAAEYGLLTHSATVETVWFEEAASSVKGDFYSGTPALEVWEQSAEGIRGRLTVPGVSYETVSTDLSDFTRLYVPGWSSTDEVGRPELPVFRTSIALPDGVDVAVEFTTSDVLSLGVESPVCHIIARDLGSGTVA